ncbi:hypothetical protein ACLKA7_016958 [Drosophila subpalustris]
MRQLHLRENTYSQFSLNVQTSRSIGMQARKLASELLRQNAMTKKFLPERRLPRYTEFKELVKAVHGKSNMANQCRRVKVFESFKDLRHLQLLQDSWNNAKSEVDTRMTPQTHKLSVDVRNKLQKINLKRDIYRRNLMLLSHINGIHRVTGNIDCFNRSFQAFEPNQYKIKKDAEALKKANHRIGCRLLRVKSEVNSFNSRFNVSLTDSHAAPADLVHRYSSYMPIQSPKNRLHSANELLRPIIYFDLCVRRNQFLGRLSIQLYTEVSPEVVLEFVRLATENDVQAHKFTHIFPDLWMRGEFTPQSRDALENHHSNPSSSLDARQPKGVLSYSWNYRKHFPNGLLLYTINFKTLAAPMQRVIFGRVLKGVRLLEFCRDCGTKYGKPKKPVNVVKSATTITLRGASYVSYRIYDWKDRVHSSTIRISLMFRTNFDDSALFYASGESLKHQYIAAAIRNQSIYVEMDFGDNVMSTVLRDDLTRGYWHNLTILHEHRTLRIILDQQQKILELLATASGNLLFDPEIYFGGGLDLHKKKGLISHNNFVGSLKYVYYNDISILYELQRGNPKVHYHGVLEAEFHENEVNVIPITYPFATSHIWWPINHAQEFNIKFDFRSSRPGAVLAYSDVTTSAGNGFWEIRLSSDKLSFDLVPDVNNNVTHSTTIKINRATSWHSVELDYKQGEIRFTVDYRHTLSQMFGLTFNIGDKLIIGSSLKSAAMGLVGCIRDIEINGHLIEPRHVVKTERVVGEVALDNCNYIDPCKRPNTCEHGGKCFVKDDRVTCDCKHTGYIGKNCHFTKYRKTCEELALLGFTKSDVYLIDIDGNGVFPPAHVKCDFQSLENATKTIVEHNLPSQVDVRSARESDFSFTIRYREFSPHMLQELISHSLYCTQYIKYDCYRAQLELHSATWFTSSAKNLTVDFLGNVKRGACPCSVNKTCVDPNQSCNCDVKENKWNSDEGYYQEPHSLGITNMYFLQQKDLDDEAQGRITLGPLECVETNTQKYVVTFTTSQSYIEVPGWRKGDIAFSFRTTGEKAILLFQPPIRAHYPSFMVALTGDYQLTFNFTLSTGTTRELVINSHRRLNGGEWHKIWIDYNQYHVRFMINTDYQMLDLLPEEEFGPFEGSMYIGGATFDLLKKLSVKAGLIGCFRGLVVNGEILDIYSYMSVHLSEIIKDCKPSCVPSPCRNGAQCKELWSSFKCVCNNPWAHIGEFCETNINEKALTFINRESFLMRNYFSVTATPAILLNGIEGERDMLKGILSQNLLINLRTYDSNALVLYANDHYNNFVHLYISQAREIVFLYNYGDEIVNLTLLDETLMANLKSIQVAIIRGEQETRMHVNQRSVSIDRGTLLLDEYANRPWSNPEKENSSLQK